jgi:hypothetical protein
MQMFCDAAVAKSTVSKQHQKNDFCFFFHEKHLFSSVYTVELTEERVMKLTQYKQGIGISKVYCVFWLLKKSVHHPRDHGFKPFFLTKG